MDWSEVNSWKIHTISINDEIALAICYIFEAAVVNYPVMHLNVDVKLQIKGAVPNAIGDKAYLQTPCVSLGEQLW
jgi:hypothetical protein